MVVMNDQSLVPLASAVVLRAFEDLATLSLEIRRDAFHFLTERLWDPGCLWFQILDPILVREHVVSEVYDRLELAYQSVVGSRAISGRPRSSSTDLDGDNE